MGARAQSCISSAFEISLAKIARIIKCSCTSASQNCRHKLAHVATNLIWTITPFCWTTSASIESKCVDNVLRPIGTTATQWNAFILPFSSHYLAHFASHRFTSHNKLWWTSISWLKPLRSQRSCWKASTLSWPTNILMNYWWTSFLVDSPTRTNFAFSQRTET